MTVRWPSHAAVLCCTVTMARVVADPQNSREVGGGDGSGFGGECGEDRAEGATTFFWGITKVC